MSRRTLERSIPAGERIVADSSALLAYLDGSETASPIASVVLDEFVRTGRNPALVSAITVTEVLVPPMQTSPAATSTVEDFLRYFPNVVMHPLDWVTACEAARIRAASGLKIPDAMVLATAVIAGIRIVVANDDRWSTAMAKATPGLTLCHLEAHLPL